MVRGSALYVFDVDGGGDVRWRRAKAALHKAGFPWVLWQAGVEIRIFEPAAPPMRKWLFHKATSPGLLPAMFTSTKVQPGRISETVNNMSEDWAVP